MSKHMKAGAYGRGLRAHFNRQREQDQRTRFLRPRDADGAYTLTGRGPNGERRIWVAGVSAQSTTI